MGPFLPICLACGLAAILCGGESEAAMRTADWRIDDVASLRDNGLRGEVVLNGRWLHERDGTQAAVLVPGRLPDLKPPKNAPADAPRPTQRAWREVEVPAAWAGRAPARPWCAASARRLSARFRLPRCR